MNPNRQKSIEVSKFIIPFSIFFILVALLFGIATLLSNLRAESVYKNYADETNAYIARNQEGLIKLFNEIMPSTNCPPDYQQASPSAVVCPNGNTISKAISSDLKDYSSTMFLKQAGNRILIMRLSGETRYFYGYWSNNNQRIAKLMKLLTGEVNKVNWDDYTYELSGKEVIIPVKDKSGKVIGAIVRGVIE